MARGAAHRGTNWTSEEDQKLFALFRAGKSWPSIAVVLRRPVASLRNRARKLKLGRATQPKTG
ncbi:SANT/Myb domain-containing protein [Bradyrhizobium sp. 76]|nr:SANT/Myb domain-containing protein [Bradyrhizobium sp. 76]